MIEEKYKELKKELEALHKTSLRKLDTDYALSNNNIKVGDIIKDHIGRIRVKGIRMTRNLYALPSCRYYGACIKKDDTLYKNGDVRWVYQSNLEKE